MPCFVFLHLPAAVLTFGLNAQITGQYYFSETKCYLWLKEELKKKDNHELYFGEATALLHNVLLNDPKPYRKEVKDLLSNLLSWITALDCEEIVVDRPNHSQRIRLIE